MAASPSSTSLAACGDSLCLIGMPGAGKSALGRTLAGLLDAPHMDTDALIEAHYGMRLQSVTDTFEKPAFVALEGAIVSALKATRSVISTGGSVIYSPQAIARLRGFGPIVYLDVSLPVLLERLAKAPDRGITFAPGETVDDLYRERRPLYEKEADIIFRPLDQGLPENARLLLHALAGAGWEPAREWSARAESQEKAPASA